ncbi:hypothetical protein [Rhodovulum euryhalinum]|uniref:Uncharacterized protein n=1 Tax=Rhodovulum euryhalinum TaxID=35805 RepID=A0A4R2K5I9_9RHOB|nr:hypothetical protein [Rhodovulum euryhalinum]TCO68501.1 hypothetical protein EV655_1278 [Rhodovulum euryhalinum]
MSDTPTLLRAVAQAFREEGPGAAITAFIGGCLAIAAAVTRKVFTNEAVLTRLDEEFAADRARLDRQRSEDRKTEADRLDRIDTDIREVRDMLFDALQQDRRD